MILRTGELDCSVYDRSVTKRLTGVWKTPADKAQAGAAVRAAGISPEGISTETATAVQTIGVDIVLSGVVSGAVNSLAAKGARAEELSAELLLPVGSEEALLRRITDQLKDQAQRAAVKAAGFRAEVTGAVTRPVLVITASGSICWPPRSECAASDEILILGYIGLEGTALLAKSCRQELEKRFPVRFLEQAAALDEELFLTQAVEAMERMDICPSCRIPVLTGGIYAALWNMTEACRHGFDIELTQIPLRQETIELTDYYGINPYQLCSAGAMLAVVEDAQKAAGDLADAGYFARPIGRLRTDRDRRIHNGEEVQSLNRPEADSILQVLGGRK